MLLHVLAHLCSMLPLTRWCILDDVARQHLPKVLAESKSPPCCLIFPSCTNPIHTPANT